MSIDPLISWQEALRRIAERAAQTDVTGAWPRENLADLAACGALGWAVPKDFGGTEMEPAELQQRYAELAGVCLTTTLVFTQRDAAVGFLLGSSPHALGDELLRGLACGKIFSTIGIAQLTTSRQHVPPAVRAEAVEGGYRVTGIIPWATGAAQAQYVVVGAALPEGKQILAAIAMDNPQVTVAPPLRLPALGGSYTSELRLENALIPEAQILRGPSENALAGRAAVRSFALPTCVLPLGLAGGALAMARELAEQRTAPAQSAIAALTSEHAALEKEVFEVGLNPAAYPMAELSPRLRAATNSLAARASLAALELSKGSGFLLEHPAQRRAREALFFFVWSSPNSVIEQTLGLLAGA